MFRLHVAVFFLFPQRNTFRGKPATIFCGNTAVSLNTYEKNMVAVLRLRLGVARIGLAWHVLAWLGMDTFYGMVKPGSVGYGADRRGMVCLGSAGINKLTRRQS